MMYKGTSFSEIFRESFKLSHSRTLRMRERQRLSMTSQFNMPDNGTIYQRGPSEVGRNAMEAIQAINEERKESSSGEEAEEI